MLLLCLQPSSTLPNLVVKTPEEILSEIYEKAIYLPRSEQGFWVVEDSTPKSDVVQTIAQTIKLLDVKFLAFNADDKREMIPSFGLQQVFLDVAFPHAVRINPVIGASTPIDIRKGSLERYRDIALPFPGNELPKVADNFPAPSALDFMFHDRYHSVRASRVIPHETELYLVIGDKLNVMQNRYNVAVKEFNKLHDEHIRLLPTFGSVIEKLPLDKRCGVTEQVRKKFNQEVAIINKLKKMRKSIGQLKFRLWDMERTFSGSSIDKPGVCAFEELQRIVASIEVDLGVLGKIDGTVELSKYSGHRVADAVLDAVKPEVVDLKSLQNLIRTVREALRGLPFFFMPAQPPGQRAYDDAILDAPVSLSQSSTSS